MQYELHALWVNIAVAVGTLAAAIVPLILYFRERQDRLDTQAALDRERTERLEEERARARATAEGEVRKVLVSSNIWPDVEYERNEDGSFTSGGTAVARLDVYVVNRSPNVIFDLSAYADAAGAVADLEDHLLPAGTPIASCGNGEPPGVARGESRGNVMHGTTEHPIRDSRVSPQKEMPEGWQDEVRRRVWIEFRDVQHRRWARYEDGEVRLLSGPTL